MLFYGDGEHEAPGMHLCVRDPDGLWPGDDFRTGGQWQGERELQRQEGAACLSLDRSSMCRATNALTWVS